ncbi:MAG: hypothetical protein PHE32_02345 [Candidatus Shapirobacteria bacterium]|nr:hypothetical protein [Candidatus Shapirobacteria bacterium]MDD4410511.1 hypothetical protein [Candidatus Shapirobacteria bacterium]
MNQLDNLSDLNKTWLIDIDGVIFIHNNYLEHNKDKLVPGIKKLLKKIGKDDCLILLTAREEKYRDLTLNSLKKYKIKYNQIIFNLPTGERILINDEKPRGLKTAIAINTVRDKASY